MPVLCVCFLAAVGTSWEPYVVLVANINRAVLISFQLGVAPSPCVYPALLSTIVFLSSLSILRVCRVAILLFFNLQFQVVSCVIVRRYHSGRCTQHCLITSSNVSGGTRGTKYHRYLRLSSLLAILIPLWLP
jgi:hypothetical protein